eukprot:4678969-Amphidinium_carterae.2
MSTTKNAHMAWADKKTRDETSPIYGWQVSQVLTALAKRRRLPRKCDPLRKHYRSRVDTHGEYVGHGALSATALRDFGDVDGPLPVPCFKTASWTMFCKPSRKYNRKPSRYTRSRDYVGHDQDKSRAAYSQSTFTITLSD